MGASISSYSSSKITLLGSGSGKVTSAAGAYSSIGSISIPRVFSYEQMIIEIIAFDGGNIDVGVGTLDGNNAPDLYSTSANTHPVMNLSCMRDGDTNDQYIFLGIEADASAGASNVVKVTRTGTPSTTPQTMYIKCKSFGINSASYRWRAYIVENS